MRTTSLNGYAVPCLDTVDLAEAIIAVIKKRISASAFESMFRAGVERLPG